MPYEAEPFKVQYRKGTKVVAKRPDGSSVTRTMLHFKKVPFRLAEEAQRWPSSEWPTEPVSEALPGTRKDTCRFPGSEQTDKTSTGIGASEPITADAVLPARLQSPQAQEGGLKRSERHQKDTRHI